MGLLNIASALLITATNTSQEFVLPKKRKDNQIFCTVADFKSDEYDFEKLTPGVSQIINKSLYEVITQISILDDNWDGYNAIAPSLTVLENLETQIKFLPNQFVEKIEEDNIYPNPNGTITLEWKNENGEVASIEIGEKTACFYANISGEMLFTKTSDLMNLTFFDTDSLSKIQKVIK